MSRTPFLASFALSAALLTSPPLANAGQRKFAYTYEVTTASKGSVEFENWITWQKRGGRVDRFDIRHEFEFGITDRLELGIYVADWRHDRTPPGSETTYLHSGAELIWNLTNPTTDLVGSALYAEVLAGDDNVSIEGKLLLQKNLGPLIIGYNAIVEAEWERDGGHWQKTGVFGQTLGVSCEAHPNVSVGIEATHEIEFADWSETGNSVVNAGPNVSFRWGRTFATVAGLWQVTHVDGEPDFQLRAIFGFHF